MRYNIVWLLIGMQCPFLWFDLELSYSKIYHDAAISTTRERARQLNLQLLSRSMSNTSALPPPLEEGPEMLL
jgi:hypothetical protein